MSGLTLTQHVNAPPELVFDLATNLPQAAQYITAIDSIELLTDGPVGVGTRWRETRTMFGRQATEEIVVTAFNRPHGYTAGGKSCGADFAFTFEFTPEGGGTLLTQRVEWAPKSLLAKLTWPMGKMMLGTMRKAMQQDLCDLKRRAEQADAS